MKWIFQDNSIPFWEPVVAADDTIYVGGGYTGDLGGFYAINPDGSLKWVNNSIRVLDSAVLGPDGQIYVIAYAYPENHPFLLALNPDGTERWRYEWFSEDYYRAELAIDHNGNIYHLTGCYSQSDQRVHPSLLAFNPQGSIIWIYDITDRQTYPNDVCTPASGMHLGGAASSALDEEGNIYSVITPNKDEAILFALRPDGTEKWRRTFNDGGAVGISIDQDGTIYVSVAALGGYGKIHAIDPSSPNQDKWVVYVQGVQSAVTIGTEDIYVIGGSAPDGTWRSYLYAFDKQGNAKWQKFIGYGATSVPILGGDGTIYIGGRQWIVYALGPDGSEKWSSNECAASSDYFAGAGGSLAIAADGTLYTAGPQKLCAFGESVTRSTSVSGEVLAVPADPGSIRFLVSEATALRVEVFNLAGRMIYDSGLVSGNSLRWDGLMSDGRRLANGVYLYVVTFRKQDGTILRSQVKKLVILR